MYTKSETRWMMTHSETWMSPRLLPLKKYIGDDELEFGLLEVNSGSTVFFEHGDDFGKLFAGKKKIYESFDALIKDGWEVD
jgi:hypothetical protein